MNINMRGFSPRLLNVYSLYIRVGYTFITAGIHRRLLMCSTPFRVKYGWVGLSVYDETHFASGKFSPLARSLTLACALGFGYESNVLPR